MPGIVRDDGPEVAVLGSPSPGIEDRCPGLVHEEALKRQRSQFPQVSRRGAGRRTSGQGVVAAHTNGSDRILLQLRICAAASPLPARLFAAIRPAKARTAAKFEVFALLAFATAANAITFVSAEGRATGCRSLMQAGADLSENQHLSYLGRHLP